MCCDIDGMSDDGLYYDQEMANIIADTAEKEIAEIYKSVMAEAMAEEAEAERVALLSYLSE